MTRALLALMLLALGLAAQAIDPLPFRDAEEEARFRRLTAELRCVMCQNQSLADSNAGVAADLRREILDLMHAGRSDEEIKAFLVERYTDFVLYDPPVRADTLLLWLGPGLILLAGTFWVSRIIRSRAAALGRDGAEPAPLDEDA